MWLYRRLPALARVAVRFFYRFEAGGEAVPGAGPVLLVANHPDAMLDPLLVAAAARRPLRFLAKAPLFTYPLLGPLVRAAGAIPVYRRRDDPALAGRNAASLAAASEALAAGDAVALFPEGISHDHPALAELKTGAARVALGAAQRLGHAVPIVPLGIVPRHKETFRSEVAVIVGAPIPWDDLASAAAAAESGDAGLVRALTERLEEGLRRVTLNLERWEDAPLVECAEAVYAVEHGASPAPADRLERLRVTTEALADVRRGRRPEIAGLVRAVRRHQRILARLHLAPADLHTGLRMETAVAWTLRRLPLLTLPLVALAAVGLAAWWIPYRLTGALVTLLQPERDIAATYKFGVGAGVFALWLLVLTGLAGALAGPGVGAICLLGLPALGLLALGIHERWADAWLEARRFFLLRREPQLLRHLRREQRELGERLARAVPPPSPPPPPPVRAPGSAPARPSPSLPLPRA
ncbi:MAG TPA: 1-acyl-sn-glycerol-3-phosphate acyltransferase [Gemmatimonadales bacterium]|nr:1-acyl-sn-glycerol-3-phosphate acyltransferase [Gemmatimonadales bacterium]